MRSDGIVVAEPSLDGCMVTVEVLRRIFGIAFLLLAVLLFNVSLTTELVVIVYPSLWPIAMNTMGSVMTVGPRLQIVARTFRLTRGRMLTRIVVPAVLPSFLLGVRVAVPLAIIITLLVEMLTLLPGVGSLIVIAQRDYRSAEVYGLLVLVGLLGFALNNAFILLENVLLRRWPPRAGDLGAR